MSRRYVAGLVAHKDHEIFLGGLFVITGFKQVPVVVHKSYKGKTTYNLRRKLGVLVNSITSFSVKPLIFIFILGILIILLAGLAALYLVIQRIFFGVFLAGWPSLIVSIWLLGGLTIFSLGIIGIYLSKVFMESKDRPYTVIRSIYDRSAGI
jgi:putative glycosyltransferase